MVTVREGGTTTGAGVEGSHREGGLQARALEGSGGEVGTVGAGHPTRDLRGTTESKCLRYRDRNVHLNIHSV